ncbi:MAG TPA: AzlC family ABC transporter permease [Polyangiaceae bacterium]|nr:AzlC family ABC transporter permease [Polyangiaceae bacterium]
MAWLPRTDAERSAFREGFRDLSPAAPATLAWGLVTGVAMVKAGLTLPQAVGMTLTVFAGSAQLAALPLISDAAPVWVVVLTSLVVNLRFVIYSAAMRGDFARFSPGRRLALGYLTGDVGFVVFLARQRRDGGLAHPDWYFFGGAACNWLAWQTGSLAGLFGAALVPTQWGLGLAGTLALLALLVPLARGRPAIVGVAVSSLVAVVAAPLPLRLGLLLAVVCGIASALLAESGAARDPGAEGAR